MYIHNTWHWFEHDHGLGHCHIWIMHSWGDKRGSGDNYSFKVDPNHRSYLRLLHLLCKNKNKKRKKGWFTATKLLTFDQKSRAGASFKLEYISMISVTNVHFPVRTYINIIMSLNVQTSFYLLYSLSLSLCGRLSLLW